MQKRLQVFISSTYEDMRAEREAAIKAILQAKHVPAGMELFAAGNESQWDVIKQWINACDVFLLILGGRYGSIEPSSGKGYIELEYDYAEQQGKELFAIVMIDASIDRKVKEKGAAVVETANGPKLEAFRKRVLERMSGRCDDDKDIALEIFKALGEIVQKDSVQGWVPGGEYRKLQIELEAAKQLRPAEGERSKEEKRERFRGLLKALEGRTIAEAAGGNLLNLLKTKQAELASDIYPAAGALFTEAGPLLEVFGLMRRNPYGRDRYTYTLTENGKATVATLIAMDAGVDLE